MKRRRGLEAAVVVATMALVAGRVLWQAAEARRVPCPQGYSENAGREERALVLLSRDPEGREAVRNASGVRGRMCFGRTEVPAVTVERTLILRRDAGDAETAARVAHLFLHLSGGFAPVDGFDAHAPCDAQVATALHAEADALDLELRLRQRLHVDAPVLRFEVQAAWDAATNGAAREQLLYDFLVAHPHGGGGVDGLADAYAQRCAEFARASR